ncbi:MAG: hypothetical protein ABWY29_11100 [Blastococcus sp.]
MTENRYAISVEELESSAHVLISEQVEVQAEPHPVVVERPRPLYPFGDGMPGDADGD